MFEDFRLKVFVKVAELGSFTAAARALGVSQPAVSQNIAELEKTLNTTLFERTKGQVILSGQGRLMEDYARQILHWYSVAEDALRNGPCSPLVLPIDELSDAQIWSSNGDLHITFKKK